MDAKTIQTTCSYCSVGCNLNIIVDADGQPKLKPTQDYTVNRGFSCAKGFHMLAPMLAPERGTTPLLRQADGALSPVDWDQAANAFVSRFKAIIAEHGPESVAFLSTGQMPTEEMAMLGLVAKMGMGWIHGDGNTRQCMATAATAYKQSFGYDAPPFTYRDAELSDLIIFVGANPVISHPIFWKRIRDRIDDATIIVIDPRRTETADGATVHLPIKPKSDLPFFYGITKILIDNDWIAPEYIEAHTEGFEELKQRVLPLDLAEIAAVSGIGIEAMHDLARRIHEAKAASLWWTMGVNQSHEATRTAQSLINIALITGNIGKPGTGANSITGQANAMGSRLFSNTTSLMGGYDFLNEEHRRHVAKVLNIPYESIPDVNSLPYHRILEEVDNGKIKGLWIVATNPAHSWIGKNSFHDAIKKLDFLVVQELYPDTETAQLCDLYLPAAASAEKDGFFINSERRLGAVVKAFDPPGQALSDFNIFLKLAKAWGADHIVKNWQTVADAFQQLKALSRGMPCDITGIRDHAHIQEKGGIQWPYPEVRSADHEESERRLFADGRYYTSSGKAKLLIDPFREPAERPDEEYPFVLLTGRGTVFQFHTQTRTGKAPFLKMKSKPNCYAEINPGDAERLGIQDGGKVKVVSRRGAAEVDAVVTDRLAPGQVFMPMHYEETNWLTCPSFDPYSFEPSYKYAAIRIEAP